MIINDKKFKAMSQFELSQWEQENFKEDVTYFVRLQGYPLAFRVFGKHLYIFGGKKNESESSSKEIKYMHPNYKHNFSGDLEVMKELEQDKWYTMLYTLDFKFNGKLYPFFENLTVYKGILCYLYRFCFLNGLLGKPDAKKDYMGAFYYTVYTYSHVDSIKDIYSRFYNDFYKDFPNITFDRSYKAIQRKVVKEKVSKEIQNYINKDYKDIYLGAWNRIANKWNTVITRENLELLRSNHMMMKAYLNSPSKVIATLQKEQKNKKLQDIHNNVKPWMGQANVMLVNLDSVLSAYYHMEIKLNYDKNAPKISKQLKKLGIIATSKELIYIGEFVNWLSNFDDDISLYLDLDDMELPTKEQLNRWAFQGSCNCLGGVGENTAEALRELGDYKYIRIYDNNKYAKARGYFKQVGDDLAHAGMYSDFNNSKLNHTAIETFTLILCALFNRKVDDFSEVKGAYIEESNSVWCNMSRLNDYTTLGTAEILKNDYIDYGADLEYSEHIGGYIDPEDDNYVYCENIDDYEYVEESAYSEYNECHLSLNGDYVYCEHNGEYYWDLNDCMEDLGIMEN